MPFIFAGQNFGPFLLNIKFWVCQKVAKTFYSRYSLRILLNFGHSYYTHFNITHINMSWACTETKLQIALQVCSCHVGKGKAYRVGVCCRRCVRLVMTCNMYSWCESLKDDLLLTLSVMSYIGQMAISYVFVFSW